MLKEEELSVIKKECVVPGCTNNNQEGNGMYMNIHNELLWICIPCYLAVFAKPHKGDRHSQVYRNMQAVKEKAEE